MKNFALEALVSTGTDEEEVERKLRDLGAERLEKGIEWEGKTALYLNGKLLGPVTDAGEFVQLVREERRNGKVSDQVNITHYPKTKEIMVN